MITESILIIDDEEDVRNLLGLALKSSGFSVRLASGGAEGLARIMEEKPALVVLDLLMPDVSGEAVCRAIKTNPALSDIIVVILSAKNDLASKLNCLRMGAEEYLTKPIDMDELVARVTRFFGLIRRWKEPRGSESTELIASSESEPRTLPTIHVSAQSAPAPPGPAPAPASKTPEIRKSVYGVYRIESVAGAGGMGLVYKAQDITLDRYVAVKVLSKEWSSSPEFVERFQREARLIAAVNHPGIAHIYTFGQEAGESYFALEWCPGGSVNNLLKRQGQIDLLPAIDIILQCARALDAALQKGVVHRDIKPSNLMFDENQQIKIVDFGVASSEKMPQSPTKSSAIAGSPAYMAPENAQTHNTDHRVDIYSLGITFYLLLYGRLPFTATSPLEYLQKHVNAPFPTYDSIGGKIPPGAYRIIQKMTTKDPKARYFRYPELIVELEKLRDELYQQKRLKIARALDISSASSLSGQNLFDLLSSIFLQQTSGVLTVSWSKLQKMFLIANNQIMAFESPQRDENPWYKLVQKNLMKKEMIPPPEEDIEESLNRLLFLHTITPEDFKAVYRETMMESVLQVFRWPVFQGDFFQARIVNESLAPIGLARIMTEAARTVIPYETIGSNLQEDSFIVRTDRFEKVVGSLNLSTAESFLVSRVEGENTSLKTLQFLTRFPEEFIGRTIFLLEHLGAFTFRSEDRSNRRKKMQTAPPPSHPVTPRPAAPPLINPVSTPAAAAQTMEQPHAKPKKKEIWIETASIRNHEEGEKQFQAAMKKFKAGQHWETERLCAQAIKNDPSQAKYHHLMALALTLKPSAARAAEEAFRKAIELDAANLTYRIEFVTFLKKRSNYKAAFEECQKILQISPREKTARRLLSEIENEKFR